MQAARRHLAHEKSHKWMDLLMVSLSGAVSEIWIPQVLIPHHTSLYFSHPLYVPLLSRYTCHYLKAHHTFPAYHAAILLCTVFEPPAAVEK